MSKRRPLRIFKLAKQPYILVKGKRIPIRGLTHEKMKKLVSLSTYYKKPRNKIADSVDLEKRIIKKVQNVIKKRSSRPRATKDTKQTQELQDQKRVLQQKVQQLENEKVIKKVEEERKEAERLKNETVEKEKKVEEGKKALEDKKREILTLNYALQSVDRQMKDVEENKDDPNEKLIAKLRSAKVEVDKMVAEGSNEEHFIRLQEFGFIPENLKFNENLEDPNTYGWKIFLESQGYKIKNVQRGVSKDAVKIEIGNHRRDWILKNEAKIIDKIIASERKKGKGINRKPNRGDVLKDTNGDGLWNYEIDEVMDDFPGYYGAVSNNEIYDMFKKIIEEKPPIFSFIYLIERYSAKTNHWVSVYVDTEFDHSVGYYDSYGKDAPEDLKKKMKFLIEALQIPQYLKWKYNPKEWQGPTSLCGVFAMNYIVLRLFGHKHKEASHYDDTKAATTRMVFFDLF